MVKWYGKISLQISVTLKDMFPSKAIVDAMSCSDVYPWIIKINIFLSTIKENSND